MEPRTTTPRGYTWEQRELLWKWHREGVPRRTIAKRLGKRPGSVHDVIRDAGSIAPRQRVRSAHHLSLEDRGLIERGLARGESCRAIARWVGCAPSTIAREVARHGVTPRCRARATRDVVSGALLSGWRRA